MCLTPSLTLVWSGRWCSFTVFHGIRTKGCRICSVYCKQGAYYCCCRVWNKNIQASYIINTILYRLKLCTSQSHYTSEIWFYYTSWICYMLYLAVCHHITWTTRATWGRNHIRGSIKVLYFFFFFSFILFHNSTWRYFIYYINLIKPKICMSLLLIKILGDCWTQF